MNSAQYEAARRRMIRDPRGVMEAARKGSSVDLTILCNGWHEHPNLISPEIVTDVFLTHLQEGRVPQSTSPSMRFAGPSNLAFTSLAGLSKVGPFLEHTLGLIETIADAWMGIFKWSVYLFSTRIETLPKTNQNRRSCLDVISACWYALCHQSFIREAMVRTPTTIEIATRLWLEEDEGPIPTSANAPMGSCVLGNLLKMAKPEELDRVMKMHGNKADEIAKLALERLQDAIKKPQASAMHLTMYLDLINSLSRDPEHAIRSALLGGNVIWIVTTGLVKISVLINTTQDLGYLDAMVSGFGYLLNCLESTDGFTWVSQAIGADLLKAYCDCSPHFSKLDPPDLKMVRDLIEGLLPRYLVYRSVIEAVDTAMIKIGNAQKDRVERSAAKEGWNKFYKLAHKRILVLMEANAMKGLHITCDNVKCQKVGTKEQVRRCAACLSTFYCSKECQATAWKEGDHKMMCKLKQRERMEGKSATILKKDFAFFRHLSLNTYRQNLLHLRALAKREFPDTPHFQIVICIDYTVTPCTFNLKLLKDYSTGPTVDTPNAEARNEALIEKVQNDPEKYALVESKISCGMSMQCILTLAIGAFCERPTRITSMGAGR